MIILLDNGHGSDTPGKRCPDGKFLEYSYNRIIAARIVSELLRPRVSIRRTASFS